MTDDYVTTSINKQLDKIFDEMNPSQEPRRSYAKRPAKPTATFPGRRRDIPRWENSGETSRASIWEMNKRRSMMFITGLYVALKAVDRNYEARLFGTPGGFALVTSVGTGAG